MNPSYNRPELVCVGAAKDVVLGSDGPGDDLHNEFLRCKLEFAPDEPQAVVD